MKYRGLIVFALLLVGTWKLSLSESLVDLETHTRLQTRLIEIIQNAVTEQRPDAIEIRFNRVWTEALGKNEILATFSYILSDSDETKESVSGEAKILRTKEGEWSIDKVLTSNNGLQFQKGLVIKSTQ